jgi:hypothetical protein
MLDGLMRRLLDPALDRAGQALATRGASADALTFAGLGLGFGAALAVAAGSGALAFGLFAANRLLDGLDGAVARATLRTDRGGFLDIVCDFAFYGAIPLAFRCARSGRERAPGDGAALRLLRQRRELLAFAAVAASAGWRARPGARSRSISPPAWRRAPRHPVLRRHDPRPQAGSRSSPTPLRASP